jgi:hypothetical protein
MEAPRGILLLSSVRFEYFLTGYIIYMSIRLLCRNTFIPALVKILPLIKLSLGSFDVIISFRP